MPTKSVATFTNRQTRTFIQEDGIGTEFTLYDCQALTEWGRDYDETTYVKVKSPNEYGEKVIKEAIPGDANEPTFTVMAYTPEEADWLLGVSCPVDFQVHIGRCSSPSDQTGYRKIRHFYRASPTSEGESALDFLGDEEYGPVEQSVEWTAEDLVTVLQVDVSRQNNGVTEANAFNDIAFLENGRCEGECGAAIDDCQWGVAVADATYGSATANVWVTADSGATWTITPFDPFGGNTANLSSCVILPGEVAPRIIVFRGNFDPAVAGPQCAITDDWGQSAWAVVNMWEVANLGHFGQYINAAFKFSVGLIYACGDNGHVYYSQDRGASWTEVTEVTTGCAVDLWDIHTPDGDRVFVVGDTNNVYRSDDNCATWTALTGPSHNNEDLLTVQAPTRYRVWVGGRIDDQDDVLWVSADGGTTWTDNDFTGSTTASGEVRRVRAAHRASQNHIVMIHGVNNGSAQRYGPGTNFRFFRTLNGGASWERQDLVTNSGLNGLYVCEINRAWAAGEAVGGVADIQRMAAT
jgi:photosystem II stability/assembly factor-like uncharacterized protein